MRAVFKSITSLLIGAVGLQFSVPESLALDLSVAPGYQAAQSSLTAGSLFDYLPDGDVVYLENTLVSTDMSGRRVYSVSVKKSDGNGDGIPASPQTIATLTDNTYAGTLLRTSPAGTHAVFSLSFTGQLGMFGESDRLWVLNLSTGALSTVQSGSSNHDIVFSSNRTFYLSNNEALFRVRPPLSKVTHVSINTGEGVDVIRFSEDVPSGVITLSAEGDLYFFKKNESAQDGKLLRFSERALIRARKNGRYLAETDAVQAIDVPSGERLAFDPNAGKKGSIYLADSALSRIVRLDLKTHVISNLLVMTDSAPPFVNGMSFLGQYGPFLPNGSPIPQLGAAVGNGTDEFLVEVNQTPRATVIGPSKVRLEAVKLNDRVKYRFTINLPGGGKRVVTSSSHRVNVRNLAPGSYNFSYRVLKKVGGQLRSTLSSHFIGFNL